MTDEMYCPFCEETESSTSAYMSLHHVICQHCGARGMSFRSEAGAVTNWMAVINKLKAYDELRAENKRLREALANCDGRCGLTYEEWERRIKNARQVLEGGNDA